MVDVTQNKKKDQNGKECFQGSSKCFDKQKDRYKKKNINSYVWSSLLYGCETWMKSKNMEEKLKSLELWFFRHMLKVSWLDRQSNEIVLDRLGAHRSVINVIKERQMPFLATYAEKESLKI